MRALCLNCTLKLTPEPSNTGDLAAHVMNALRERGFEVETIRVTDHVVESAQSAQAVLQFIVPDAASILMAAGNATAPGSA